MNPTLWPYLAGTALAYGLVAAPLWGVLRLTGQDTEEYAQRLGFYRLPPRGAGERLWMQAVSVGEVRLAATLIDGLRARRPGLEVVLSTGTRAGFREAQRLLGGLAEVIYFPVDSPICVRRALKAVRPDMVAILETELWPAFLRQALADGAKVVLLNGRISDRTARVYRHLAPMFRPLLREFSGAAALTEKDAARLIHLGVRPERVMVTGNAKSDSLPVQADEAAAERLGRELDLIGRPVWVAGSIRTGEDELVAQAFKRVLAVEPKAVLVLAPRHLRRLERMVKSLEQAGLSHELRTRLTNGRPRRAPVVILDTMGELFPLYRSAWVALAGGSLVPLGGQNPLEPAYWGVPVLFGPHMDDFAEASERLISAGGAEVVTDARQLAERVSEHLTKPELRRRTGEAARRAFLAQSGAAGKAIDLIIRVLDGKG